MKSIKFDCPKCGFENKLKFSFSSISKCEVCNAYLMVSPTNKNLNKNNRLLNIIGFVLFLIYGGLMLFVSELNSHKVVFSILILATYLAFGIFLGPKDTNYEAKEIPSSAIIGGKYADLLFNIFIVVSILIFILVVFLKSPTFK